MNDKFTIIDNLSDARIKARAIAQLGALQGTWRIEACRYRPRRSDRQNRWYWPCFVQPFAEYLVEQGNEFRDAENEAHEILKARHLKVQIIDKQTGERFVFVRSTTTLTTTEFNEYLEKCAMTLAEVGIVVPEPSVWRERETLAAAG